MPRSAGFSVAEWQGNIVVFGGNSADAAQIRFSNTVWLLDAATGGLREVSCGGRPPLPQAHHTACVWNDEMYVVQGLGDDNTHPAWLTTPVLNLRTWTWRAIAHPGQRMPALRCHHASTVIGDTLYTFGGYSLHDQQPVKSEIFCLDLHSQQYTTVEVPLFRPLWGHSMTSLHGLLVLFGGVETNKDINTIGIFDTQKHQAKVLTYENHPGVTDRVDVVQATSTFEPQDTRQLRIVKGDIIHVLAGENVQDVMPEWYKGFVGDNSERRGWFPKNFVKRVLAGKLVSKLALPREERLSEREEGTRLQLVETGEVLKVERRGAAGVGYHYRYLPREEYSDAEKLFTPQPMVVPDARSLHTGVGTPGGLFVYCGEQQDVPLADSWVLDLADKKRWARTASPPCDMFDAPGVLLGQNKVAVVGLSTADLFGGEATLTSASKLMLYDLAADRWAVQDIRTLPPATPQSHTPSHAAPSSAASAGRGRKASNASIRSDASTIVGPAAIRAESLGRQEVVKTPQPQPDPPRPLPPHPVHSPTAASSRFSPIPTNPDYMKEQAYQLDRVFNSPLPPSGVLAAYKPPAAAAPEPNVAAKALSPPRSPLHVSHNHMASPRAVPANFPVLFDPVLEKYMDPCPPFSDVIKVSDDVRRAATIRGMTSPRPPAATASPSHGHLRDLPATASPPVAPSSVVALAAQAGTPASALPRPPSVASISMEVLPMPPPASVAPETSAMEPAPSAASMHGTEQRQVSIPASAAATSEADAATLEPVRTRTPVQLDTAASTLLRKASTRSAGGSLGMPSTPTSLMHRTASPARKRPAASGHTGGCGGEARSLSPVRPPADAPASSATAAGGAPPIDTESKATHSLAGSAAAAPAAALLAADPAPAAAKRVMAIPEPYASMPFVRDTYQHGGGGGGGVVGLTSSPSASGLRNIISSARRRSLDSPPPRVQPEAVAAATAAAANAHAASSIASASVEPPPAIDRASTPVELHSHSATLVVSKRRSVEPVQSASEAAALHQYAAAAAASLEQRVLDLEQRAAKQPALDAAAVAATGTPTHAARTYTPAGLGSSLQQRGWAPPPSTSDAVLDPTGVAALASTASSLMQLPEASPTQPAPPPVLTTTAASVVSPAHASTPTHPVAATVSPPTAVAVQPPGALHSHLSTHSIGVGSVHAAPAPATPLERPSIASAKQSVHPVSAGVGTEPTRTASLQEVWSSSPPAPMPALGDPAGLPASKSAFASHADASSTSALMQQFASVDAAPHGGPSSSTHFIGGGRHDTFASILTAASTQHGLPRAGVVSTIDALPPAEQHRSHSLSPTHRCPPGVEALHGRVVVHAQTETQPHRSYSIERSAGPRVGVGSSVYLTGEAGTQSVSISAERDSDYGGVVTPAQRQEFRAGLKDAATAVDDIPHKDRATSVMTDEFFAGLRRSPPPRRYEEPPADPDELVVLKHSGEKLGMVWRGDLLVSVDADGPAGLCGGEMFIGRTLTHVAGVPYASLKSIAKATAEMQTVRLGFKGNMTDSELADHVLRTLAAEREAPRSVSPPVRKKKAKRSTSTPRVPRPSSTPRKKGTPSTPSVRPSRSSRTPVRPPVRELSPSHLSGLHTNASMRKRRSFSSEDPSSYYMIQEGLVRDSSIPRTHHQPLPKSRVLGKPSAKGSPLKATRSPRSIPKSERLVMS